MAKTGFPMSISETSNGVQMTSDIKFEGHDHHDLKVDKMNNISLKSDSAPNCVKMTTITICLLFLRSTGIYIMQN